NSELVTSFASQDVESILLKAAQSEHPIEKSAALMIIWNLEHKSSIELIRSVIHQPSFDMVKEATISLLQPDKQILNQAFLLKLTLLVESEELNNFHINELEYLAENGTVVDFPENETLCKKGNPADSVFVLQSGSVRIEDTIETNQSVSRKGSIIGIETLQSITTYQNTITSQGSTALCIPKNALISCSYIYPEFAINLFLRGQS